MKKHALVTAVGADRVGIVDDLSGEILTRGWNIEESRMALLGGDFAALLLVSAEEGTSSALIDEMPAIGSRLGLAASARPTSGPHAENEALPYILESASLDTPGIVRALSQSLRRFGVNIVGMETDTSPAPWSGAPMFTLRARLLVPRSVAVAELRDELSRVEAAHNLDLTLTSATLAEQ